MKILIASSEVVPFSKTGGLADVAGALPRYINELGHEVAVFMPAYRSIYDAGIEFQDTGVKFQIALGSKIADGRLLAAKIPGNNVTYYAIENQSYFDRPSLYGEDGQDYPDNCERFVFFSRAVLECVRLLDWQPELIHANDWQTGLIPAYLKTELASVAFYENIASLITIHNLAYQGSFWHWDMLLTGIDWKHFNWLEMEFFGRLNLLKTGLAFADCINTVSPTYAVEIQSEQQGCGLDGVLRHRSDVLSGILNGIDPGQWDPKTDPHLAVNYDVSSWENGKAACKRSLQQQQNLSVDADVPLIGIVSRLASQKGWSLIIPVMEAWLAQRDVQWVVLGTGQAEYHLALEDLQRRYPGKLAVQLAFSNPLAHQIESGSDMFLMPSEYEPCGLNQMYSLTYGTIPIVRSTGGLADTVIDATASTLENSTANGFCFENFDIDSLNTAVSRAVEMFGDDKTWSQLVKTAMQQDWTWSASAKKYCRLYEQTINVKLANRQMV